jgi:hypothetical protein
LNPDLPATFTLIDSTQQKKLSPILFGVYCALFLFFFISLKLPHVINGRFALKTVASDIGINVSIIYGIMIVLVLAAVPLYYYAKKYPVLGSLMLDTNQLTIIDPEGKISYYKLTDLEKLHISRGSTVHKTDNGWFGPDTNNNWISFSFNHVDTKIEFAIRNEEENSRFESVVYELRSILDGFVYTSI